MASRKAASRCATSIEKMKRLSTPGSTNVAGAPGNGTATFGAFAAASTTCPNQRPALGGGVALNQLVDEAEARPPNPRRSRGIRPRGWASPDPLDSAERVVVGSLPREPERTTAMPTNSSNERSRPVVEVSEVTPGEWRVLLRGAQREAETLDAAEARERADALEEADEDLAHELRKAALVVDEKTIAI